MQAASPSSLATWRIVAAGTVVIQGESCRALPAVHLERTLELGGAAPIVRLRLAVGIHVQRMPCLLVEDDALGIQVDQRRAVGTIRKELDVDEVFLVNEHVRDGKRHRCRGE